MPEMEQRRFEDQLGAAPAVAKVYLLADAVKGVDVAARTIAGWVSKETVDRDGEVLLAEGCDTTWYQPGQNAPLLWGHEAWSLPVAKCIAIDRVPGEGVPAQFQFGRHQLAADVFECYADGLLKAFSVGFSPIDVDRTPVKPGQTGVTHRRWELLEVSAVTIPSCREALAKAAIEGHAGARTMLEVYYRDDLEALRADKDAWEQYRVDGDLRRAKGALEALRNYARSRTKVGVVWAPPAKSVDELTALLAELQGNADGDAGDLGGAPAPEAAGASDACQACATACTQCIATLASCLDVCGLALGGAEEALRAVPAACPEAERACRRCMEACAACVAGCAADGKGDCVEACARCLAACSAAAQACAAVGDGSNADALASCLEQCRVCTAACGECYEACQARPGNEGDSAVMAEPDPAMAFLAALNAVPKAAPTDPEPESHPADDGALSDVARELIPVLREVKDLIAAQRPDTLAAEAVRELKLASIGGR